jgi:hypothetical protein
VVVRSRAKRWRSPAVSPPATREGYFPENFDVVNGSYCIADHVADDAVSC